MKKRNRTPKPRPLTLPEELLAALEEAQGTIDHLIGYAGGTGGFGQYEALIQRAKQSLGVTPSQAPTGEADMKEPYAPSSLSWCEHCGEGVTDFCRGKLRLCPSGLRVLHRNAGVPASSDASAWWSLVMDAAASIEDAANCLRDPDAKKQAEGAAKHYREAAQKLMAAPGVETSDGGQP